MAFESSTAFLPHGYCLSWSPALIGAVAASHLMIGLSYLSIPVALFFFAKRHPELNHRMLFALFVLFIVGCGATHIIELINIWMPLYRLDSVVLAGTAVVSVVTAALIWPQTADATAALRSYSKTRLDLLSANHQLFVSVAELKQVNIKLDQSERRFRLSVQYAPNGQATVALDGHWMMVNQSLCKMLGYSEAELVTKTFQDLTHPDDLEADLQHVKELLSGDSVSYRMEKRYFCKSGELLYGQLDVALLRSPQNEPLYFIVQIQDITERRNAERAARVAERRFHQMIENVSDYAILSLDLEGRVVSWNEGVRRINGYAPEEIIGRGFSCFYLPEDVVVARPEQMLKTAMSEGQCREEGWRIRKDGSRFWASVLLTAIRDADGKLIGYTKITRDLTERRKAEQVLAQSNSLTSAIMVAAPYSIIATDPQGIITSVNPAAERMLWYSREELVGRQSVESIHDAQEIATRTSELSNKLGRTIELGFEVLVYESRSGLVEEHEWTYVRKDGSRFPVHLAVSALRGADNEVIGFLGIAYDITQRKLRDEYTRHIAHHDELTDLPNRTLLYDRLKVSLESATRNQRTVGVLMIDLDHFKRVNDLYGHHVGDQLLKVVAERISTTVRNSDTVARMGGDEFVVLMPEISANDGADIVAGKIVKAISAPIQVGKHELRVTASIGVSCYPGDGNDTHQLLKNADAAMYHAKSVGRSGYQHFNLEVQKIEYRKLAMEVDLRNAIANNKIHVHYQPQVCLKTGRIIGVEALARWSDPETSPELFIPVAEDSGLIIALGESVLRTACRDARILQQQAGHPLMMAVNLSARQFREAGLMQMVLSALNDFDVDPHLLEIEITESVLMDNHDDAHALVQRLRDIGISIAIDDFGTGYSSLSYLTQFPINTLKIDRSFISRMTTSAGDAAVVDAIIAIARSLKIKVVAEGVETPEQLSFLQGLVFNAAQGVVLGRAAPIDYFSVQGFHFSKPLSMSDLTGTYDQLQVSSEEWIKSSLCRNFVEPPLL